MLMVKLIIKKVLIYLAAYIRQTHVLGSTFARLISAPSKHTSSQPPSASSSFVGSADRTPSEAFTGVVTVVDGATYTDATAAPVEGAPILQHNTQPITTSNGATKQH